MSMIEVAVAGCSGRMGSAVIEAVNAEEGMRIACGIDPHAQAAGVDAPFPTFASIEEALDATKADVLVDFTAPAVVAHDIEVALAHGLDVVVGTTGLSPEDLDALYSASDGTHCLFFAPNFTIGAVLMMRFARACAPYFPEAEVIEMHHCNKLDAPSGTAVQTARIISEAREGMPSCAPGSDTEIAGMEGARGARVGDVFVHSVRSNGFVANQQVIFGSPGQTLTIEHASWERTSYMPGVILAIRSVIGRRGVIVGLEHFLDD